MPGIFWLRFGAIWILALVMRPLVLADSGTERQSGSSKAPISSSDNEAWTVDLNSSGGFHGMGGAHISSRGIVLASRFNVMSPRHRPCQSQLSAQDMQTIDRAVSSANASAWKSNYVPDGDNGCCDRFRWSLLLYRRAADGTGRTYGTHWYGGNEKHLPGDLAALRATVLTIMKTALSRCTQ